jgi:hypothetical protein
LENCAIQFSAEKYVGDVGDDLGGTKQTSLGKLVPDPNADSIASNWWQS